MHGDVSLSCLVSCCRHQSKADWALSRPAGFDVKLFRTSFFLDFPCSLSLHMKWLPWVQEVSRFSAPPCFHWSLLVSNIQGSRSFPPLYSTTGPSLGPVVPQGGAEEGSDAGLINFSLSAHSHRCPIRHLWNCRTLLSEWPAPTQ